MTGGGGLSHEYLATLATIWSTASLESAIRANLTASRTSADSSRSESPSRDVRRDVRLHGTGLGWEKYTACYNVLTDAKAMGFISGLESRGAADMSVPVVGEDGLHTIEVFGGQNGYPFLNKHETSWPWERVYRFAFMIESEAPPITSADATVSVWALPPAIGLAALLGFAAAAAVSRRRRAVAPDREAREDAD